MICILIFNGSHKYEKAYCEPVGDLTEQDIQQNVDDILGDIDSNELDDFLNYDFNLDFFSVSSVRELVKNILDGKYFTEYSSLFDCVGSIIKDGLKNTVSAFVILFVIVMLYEIFANFCPSKFEDFKKSVKVIFSLVIVLLLALMFKDIASDLSSVISKIFNFIKLLFPILLSLILLSGATGTHAVYSSLTTFLLNTGSYIFVYILLPISISILFLSLVGSAFSSKRFEKVTDIFKSIFKYTLAAFFGLFGVLSAVNLIISGAHDGVSVKLTKYAIKNYIPLLGGYISDGFDFVHTCALLVKNAFGVCGIFILLFIVLKPLVYYFIYIICFKILSALVSFVSDTHFSEIFNNVSKCLSYFVAVLIGIFLIFFIFIYLLIVSVSIT